MKVEEKKVVNVEVEEKKYVEPKKLMSEEKKFIQE
jgi:hypothetical protein